MNGTLHFSVLDGWWVEGYHAFAGWALPKKRIFENQDLQDDVDAETIYNMLEYEIVPAYYSFNKHGVPAEWISHIKNTMVIGSEEIGKGEAIYITDNPYFRAFWKSGRILLWNVLFR